MIEGAFISTFVLQIAWPDSDIPLPKNQPSFLFIFILSWDNKTLFLKPVHVPAKKNKEKNEMLKKEHWETDQFFLFLFLSEGQHQTLLFSGINIFFMDVYWY